METTLQIYSTPTDNGFETLYTSSSAIVVNEDCFIQIFKLIKKFENFNTLTLCYHHITWLNNNLSLLLSEISALVWDEPTEEVLRIKQEKYACLNELKRQFLKEKIVSIKFEHIDTFENYIAIGKYFDSITANDIDCKYHDEEKFIPEYDTTGYLSGLQKDWINRISIIHRIYQEAELEHSSKSHKSKNSNSLTGSLKSMIGWNKTNYSSIPERSIEYHHPEELKPLISNQPHAQDLFFNTEETTSSDNGSVEVGFQILAALGFFGFMAVCVIQ
jgi:hypothetical protein